jgi:hypothetical protein
VLDTERLAVLQKESAKRLVEAEARIRTELGRRVDNTNSGRIQKGAMTLLTEMWHTEKFKVQDDPVKAQEKYNELWQKAWAMSLYEPMTESTQPGKVFSPTPVILNTVIGLIDAKAPKILKLTQKGLEEYDSDFMSYLATVPKHSREADLLAEFVSLLYAARRDLGPAKRNTPAYARLAQFAQGILDEGIKPITKRSGTLLNFGSPQQMQAMLYSLLELPIRRRSKNAFGSLRERERLPGSPATGIKAVASALAYDCQEGDWRRPVLEDYRLVSQEQQKESLYFSKWPLWIHPRDGRVHPAIKNCGTVTRRPSGTNLNVLQVAKGEMRSPFKPGKGRVVVSIDFSNQELVILACESRDPVMLDAFTSTPRKDIHSVTSVRYAPMLLPRLGGPSLSSISYEAFYAALHSEDANVAKPFKQLRNKYSKAVNFLLAFLGGYKTLAENLSIHPDLAKDLMNQIFMLYARVQPWQNEVIQFARAHGYSETAFGNRRHVSKDIHSSEDGLRKRMERQAVNAEIQSTAADILKVVRQRMFERDIRQRYQTQSVFPIYDELTASVPIELALDYAFEMKEIMEITPPGYPVGMACDLSIGPTWGTQKELSFDREKVQTYLNELEKSL